MAASAELVLGLPFLFWILLFSLVTVALEIFLRYRAYAKVLKFLTFSLFAYIITAFMVTSDWSQVLRSTIIPTISFEEEFIFAIVAILGTTISPYLFFWQSDEEAEEDRLKHRIIATGKGIPKISRKILGEMRIDTAVGMFFSNIVMFFIILTVGSTLYPQGITSIETAEQAASALKPIAGDFAFLLFAAGIIGTGLLAVPILSGSASYAMSESFGWKASLDAKFSKAHRFYFIIILATFLGILINFLGIPPMRMLFYSAILNGLCAPLLLFLILRISNNKKILGSYTNSMKSNVVGSLTLIVMLFAGSALVLSLLGII